MPYLTAHALDRCNEWLVGWRLGRRHPPSRRDELADYLESLRGFHPDPDAGAPLEPSPRAEGRWEADTPWTRATGANHRWYADRFVPSDEGAGSKAGPGDQVVWPALILLHGWLMDPPQLAVFRSWARSAARAGIEVWLPRLPHHMERAAAGEVSGQRCLSSDLAGSIDAIRQAVLETRSLVSCLRRRGAPRVGLWGMSLGGWIAALTATLDPSLDAVALWAPVAAPLEVLWEARLTRRLRRSIAAGGIHEADLDVEAFHALTPAGLDVQVPRSRVLIIGAAHDRVVSAGSLSRMARRWNIDVQWLPHGHISLMLSRAPVHATVDFLHETLVGKPIDASPV